MPDSRDSSPLDTGKGDSARLARLDHMIADGRAHNLRLTQERHEREGTCGCGIPKDQCAPERCSHPFARDAMWGDS